MKGTGDIVIQPVPFFYSLNLIKMKKKLPINTIKNIVDNSDNIYNALIKLYEYVLGHNFDEIESIDIWPKCNRHTAEYILKELHGKFDATSVNLTWLNKGFSSNSEDLKDFIVEIPKNSFKLTVQKLESQNIIESYARKEVEEFFNDSKDVTTD